MKSLTDVDGVFVGRHSLFTFPEGMGYNQGYLFVSIVRLTCKGGVEEILGESKSVHCPGCDSRLGVGKWTPARFAQPPLNSRRVQVSQESSQKQVPSR